MHPEWRHCARRASVTLPWGSAAMVAVYLVALIALGILDSRVSKHWITLGAVAVIIWAGPACVVAEIAWLYLKRKPGSTRPSLRALIFTWVLLALLWVSHVLCYTYVLRDIARVRSRMAFYGEDASKLAKPTEGQQRINHKSPWLVP